MIVPDTKDWTWVLDEPCPECGFVAADVDRGSVGDVIRDDARGWAVVLAQPGADARPDASTWSPLEYGCHVRDVHRLFAERLDLMLAEDGAAFANWDQDVTALEDGYDRQDPAVVGPELVAAAAAVAERYDALRDADEATWQRRGLRSDGSVFSVDAFARYHLHDVLHHTHDVRDVVARATAAAYSADAEGYSAATAQPSAELLVQVDAFAAAVGAGGAVLEIGSGGGRDAAALEERGLRVRRTDISAGFVERLRALGHEADVLDPLRDELGGPYDGVWASACLLHVARPELPTVLARLASATRPGGVLSLSLKEGDGEEWSVHGQVRAPRRFVYWREEPLRAAVEGAGWQVLALGHAQGRDGQPWLTLRASCSGS